MLSKRKVVRRRLLAVVLLVMLVMVRLWFERWGCGRDIHQMRKRVVLLGVNVGFHPWVLVFFYSITKDIRIIFVLFLLLFDLMKHVLHASLTSKVRISF